MSNTITITKSFSGGGPNSVGSSETIAVGAMITLNGACGNGTTTLATPVVENLGTQCAAYAMTADGNCTIVVDGTSVTDASISLTAGVTKIERGDGTTVPGLNSGADSFTFKVLNASTVSVNVDIRLGIL